MGKSLETTKGSVWALFLTTHAVLVERIEERLAQAKLPPLGWYDVLWALERADDQRARMSELADKVVLSRSNLTRLVDRLEDARLVARERSEEDRRGAYAVLTAQGKVMRKQMWPVYQTAIRDLFEKAITDDEAQVVEVVLRRILDAARGQQDAASAAASTASKATGGKRLGKR